MEIGRSIRGLVSWYKHCHFAWVGGNWADAIIVRDEMDYYVVMVHSAA